MLHVFSESHAWMGPQFEYSHGIWKQRWEALAVGTTWQIGGDEKKVCSTAISQPLGPSAIVFQGPQTAEFQICYSKNALLNLDSNAVMHYLIVASYYAVSLLFLLDDRVLGKCFGLRVRPWVLSFWALFSHLKISRTSIYLYILIHMSRVFAYLNI